MSPIAHRRHRRLLPVAAVAAAAMLVVGIGVAVRGSQHPPEVADADDTVRVYDVRVSETLTGNGGRDTVRVHVLQAVGEHQLQIEGRPTLQVGDEALWILQGMAPQDGVDHIPVSTASIIGIDSGEVAPVEGEAPALHQARELGLEGTIRELTIG